MIGYLEGSVKHYNTGRIVLFTGGIGFTVAVPKNLVFQESQKISLYIHTHLREDELSLYGFERYDDLNLFEKLISVSGVGPKIALALLSLSTHDNVINAIETSNLNFFTSIPGVGKKTGQKIILDLKSKISKGDIDMKNIEGSSELVDSLVSLGFQKAEIVKVIPDIDSSADLPVQIKTALKLLNK